MQVPAPCPNCQIHRLHDDGHGDHVRIRSGHDDRDDGHVHRAPVPSDDVHLLTVLVARDDVPALSVPHARDDAHVRSVRHGRDDGDGARAPLPTLPTTHSLNL